MPRQATYPAVVVFTSADYFEAQLVAGALRGHRISAFVFDDNVCRIAPWSSVLVGGVKVIVYRRDIEQTIQILKLVLSGEPLFEGKCLSIPMGDIATYIMLAKALFRKWVQPSSQ